MFFAVIVVAVVLVVAALLLAASQLIPLSLPGANPCDGDLVPSPVTGKCECPAGKLQDLVTKTRCLAACPPPTVPDPLGKACQCPPNSILTPTGCLQCPRTQIAAGNICGCLGGRSPDPGTGECPCGRGAVRSATTGLCGCPATMVATPAGDCECPGGMIQSGDKCICPAGLAYDADLRLCVAGCPADQALSKELPFDGTVHRLRVLNPTNEAVRKSRVSLVANSGGRWSCQPKKDGTGTPASGTFMTGDAGDIIQYVVTEPGNGHLPWDFLEYGVAQPVTLSGLAVPKDYGQNPASEMYPSLDYCQCLAKQARLDYDGRCTVPAIGCAAGCSISPSRTCVAATAAATDGTPCPECSPEYREDAAKTPVPECCLYPKYRIYLPTHNLKDRYGWSEEEGRTVFYQGLIPDTDFTARNSLPFVTDCLRLFGCNYESTIIGAFSTWLDVINAAGREWIALKALAVERNKDKRKASPPESYATTATLKLLLFAGFIDYRDVSVQTSLFLVAVAMCDKTLVADAVLQIGDFENLHLAVQTQPLGETELTVPLRNAVFQMASVADEARRLCWWYLKVLKGLETCNRHPSRCGAKSPCGAGTCVEWLEGSVWCECPPMEVRDCSRGDGDNHTGDFDDGDNDRGKLWRLRYAAANRGQCGGDVVVPRQFQLRHSAPAGGGGEHVCGTRLVPRDYGNRGPVGGRCEISGNDLFPGEQDRNRHREENNNTWKDFCL